MANRQQQPLQCYHQQNTYQAEDAEMVGAIAVANQPGYNGDGFADFMNASNDYNQMECVCTNRWNLHNYLRYALTANRPLRLTINDVVKVASLAFPVTGAWTNWSTFSTNQPLVEGPNSIMLTAIGTSGGNFDELTISGNGISALNNTKPDFDGKTVRIYPNPLNTTKLSIDMAGFENSNNVQVKILNLLGQTVFHENLNNPSHFEINTLNLLSKSVYTVSVESGSTKIVNKLILN
jgi:hypothetical protein